MKKLLVSIIIPLKNRKELILETLASIQCQTYQNWEAIVVDDHSSDGGDDAVRDLARKETRIKFFRRSSPTPGAPACRNEGFNVSTGDLVIYLDSDDLLAADCLEYRLAVMESRSELDFAVFRARQFNREPGDSPLLVNRFTEVDDLSRFLARHLPWGTAAPIWRREFLEKHDGWDETLPQGQDIDFNIVALCGRPTYTKIDRLDLYYRMDFSTDQIGTNPWRIELLPHHERRLKKALSSVCSAGLLENETRWALAGAFLFLARKWKGHDNLQRALDIWRHARKKKLVGLSAYLIARVFLISESYTTQSLIVYFFLNRWPEISRHGEVDAVGRLHSESGGEKPMEVWTNMPVYKGYEAVFSAGPIRFLIGQILPESLKKRLR